MGNVGYAQIADFAKSWDSATWRKTHAACAREKAALRRKCSLIAWTNERDADEVTVYAPFRKVQIQAKVGLA
jgi:hypothetical protein